MKNKQLKTNCRINTVAFCVFLIIICLACYLFYNLITEFFGHTAVTVIAFAVFIILCLAFIIYYLYSHVIILWKLIKKAPEKCKLEDIFIIRSTDTDRRAQYSPYPIVRSLSDDKLYLAYGDYSLLGFRKEINRADKNNIGCTLYRENGSPVAIGENVDMYMWKTLNIAFAVDSEKNTVKLKSTKYPFLHVNENTDVEIFSSIVFFKGIIDLDSEEL